MTIDQFIRKWAPHDIGAINEFQTDLFSVCSEGEKDFQKVALGVLTYPDKATLKIVNGEDRTSILYYRTGTDPNNGTIWTVPIESGITDKDWLWVLQGLADYYIQSLKK